MLIRSEHLTRMVAGEITLAFRRWKRPTVKAGGTLKTKLGVLAIDAVDEVTMKSITEAEARKSGFATRAELLAILKTREGKVYRVKLHYLGEDPRIALRKNSKLTAADREEIQAKLDRYDKHSKLGPWTRCVLECIRDNPATLAANLADELGYTKAWFKPNVRKLKALGLTDSLDVGYRLSPRGRALLRVK